MLYVSDRLNQPPVPTALFNLRTTVEADLDGLSGARQSAPRSGGTPDKDVRLTR